MTVNRTRRRQTQAAKAQAAKPLTSRDPEAKGAAKGGEGISAAAIENLAGFLEDLEALDEAPATNPGLPPKVEAAPAPKPLDLPKPTPPNQPQEKTMTKPKAASKALVVQEPGLSVMGRPIMPSEIEVVETISLSGGRPIEASNMDLYGSFLNGRPIESTHLTIEAMLPGDRPVFGSEVEMLDEILPGGRPIMVSPASLMQATSLPGGRPIASNQIDDPANLMGFLD
jgi:hypothetical protein